MTRFLPILVFCLLLALLGYGLTKDPREVSSPLIDKPVPKFALPTLWDEKKQLTEKELSKKPSLFNVWASWCVACREEHPVLLKLSQTSDVPLYSLNYKDQRSEAQRWLQTFGGDPYTAIAFDQSGTTGIDWGVYGVPETFVVDRKGIIRYKHIGPISEKSLHEILLPLLDKLNHEP